jgi:hypothetical protein
MLNYPVPNFLPDFFFLSFLSCRRGKAKLVMGHAWVSSRFFTMEEMALNFFEFECVYFTVKFITFEK